MFCRPSPELTACLFWNPSREWWDALLLRSGSHVGPTRSVVTMLAIPTPTPGKNAEWLG